MSEYETNYTDEAVCPYCGAELCMTYELFMYANDTAKTDCGECGSEFEVHMIVDVSYCTYKIQTEVTP